jgi:hypothetical protein
MTAGTAITRLTANPLVKHLLWSGLQAGIGALASQASARLARRIWMRVFGEPPPDDHSRRASNRPPSSRHSLPTER